MKTIIAKLQARFDGVPNHVVATIAEAALTEAGKTRLDRQVRYDAGSDRTRDLERQRARLDHHRDEATASIKNQWQREA